VRVDTVLPVKDSWQEYGCPDIDGENDLYDTCSSVCIFNIDWSGAWRSLIQLPASFGGAIQLLLWLLPVRFLLSSFQSVSYIF